jgi:GrpB-like predicted nucleotidyltransferase (UPF0157 family)
LGTHPLIKYVSLIYEELGYFVRKSKEEPLVICPYNSEWKTLFTDEEKLLRLHLGEEYRSIIHIGSTSIEGLDAKPIIDISIAVHELKDTAFYEKKLSPVGYEHCNGSKFEEWILLEKNDCGQEYHAHLMPYDSRRLFKQVLFKIFMEESPSAADLYVRKKKAYLALDEHMWYSMNKKPFVDEINLYALLDAIEHPIYWIERIYDIMGYVPHTKLFAFVKEKREAKQTGLEAAYKLLKKDRDTKIETIMEIAGLTREEVCFLF